MWHDGLWKNSSGEFRFGRYCYVWGSDTWHIRLSGEDCTRVSKGDVPNTKDWKYVERKETAKLWPRCHQEEEGRNGEDRQSAT